MIDFRFSYGSMPPFTWYDGASEGSFRFRINDGSGQGEDSPEPAYTETKASILRRYLPVFLIMSHQWEYNVFLNKMCHIFPYISSLDVALYQSFATMMKNRTLVLDLKETTADCHYWMLQTVSDFNVIINKVDTEHGVIGAWVTSQRHEWI